jgi:putative iron-dependent peroxidase
MSVSSSAECTGAGPARPQPVVGLPARAGIFLVLSVEPGGEAAVREVLGGLNGLLRSVSFRVPDGESSCIAAIGSDAWDRLFDGPRPAELHPFRAPVGARHRAVATPGDLLFHLRARRADLCFELAAQLMRGLGGAVAVADEVHGFSYFEERDLLGFVDGSENPTGPDARAAVYVGEEDAAFAGGSYVIVQKYLHDMDGWRAISTEEQERVIGRSKQDNIELAEGVKPANSHVALNTVTGADGTDRQIVRENMPFGAPGAPGGGEFGTYFIGYSRTPSITEQMLENMFVGRPPGNYDRILDFSTAVTGGLFFVPSSGFLDELPDAPG